MRRLLMLMACVFSFALLFLLGRSLVSGPVTGEAAGSLAADCGAPVFRVPAGQEENLPDTGRIRPSRTENAALAPRENAGIVSLTTDRNGMPLRGSTWRRTVYLVCPPEGVPG